MKKTSALTLVSLFSFLTPLYAATPQTTHVVHFQSMPSEYSDIQKDVEAAGYKVLGTDQGGVYLHYDTWAQRNSITPETLGIGRENIDYTDMRPYNYATNKNRHPGYYDGSKGMSTGTHMVLKYRKEGLYLVGNFVGGVVATGSNDNHYIAYQDHSTVDVALPARKVSWKNKTAFAFHGVNRAGRQQIVIVSVD